MFKFLYKRILCLLFIVIFLVNGFCSYSFANTNSSSTECYSSASEAPSTYSPACLLMDLDSGKILYSKNANAKMYPASTTKIMTAILTLENCQLNDTAVASHNAIYSIPVGYSHANIQEGEELTIEQLLNVLLIPSANDAAVILAEHIAGSVENFATMMNEKAKELGCTNTNFVNPNGIHNENHYSTAYDLALIGKYAMTFSVFRSIVSKTSYALPATAKYDKADRLFNTTNDLIKKNYSSSPTNYYYEYATGAKTGYTDMAKNCIVATATKNDVSLIAVVLHAESTEDGLSQRALDCKALFEYGFNNFSVEKIIEEGSVAHTINVSGATKDTASLDLVFSKDVYGLIPNGYDLSSVTPNITLSDNISAPIAEGTKLGQITYTIDGYDYSCDILASHQVFKVDFIKTLMQLSILIIFLFFFAKFLGVKNKRKLKSSKKRKRSNKNYVKDFYPNYK
ncbi:MAG: serine hydrolase [Clostridia bacterium]